MKRTLLTGPIALVALALSAGGVTSQTPQPTGPTGWLGLAYALQVARTERGEPRVNAVVTEVMAGSPAAEAGVRPGDVIVRINGREVTSRGLGVIHLRPGDTVSLVVEDGGQRREVTVRAASRPSNVPRPPLPPEVAWTLHPNLDSVAEAMYRAMDSLRVRLRGGAALAALASELRGRADSLAAAAGRLRALPRTGTPFDVYVYRNLAYDSLRKEMARLNGELMRTRRQQDAARIARSGQATAAARAAAAARAETGGLPPEALARAQELSDLRPLAPYILGQNRALGAQVLDLRPELAAYFGVAEGVLVVDVPEDSPAADAGLAPGDVITAVADRPVRSLRDLRIALSRAGGRTALTVVRKRVSRQVALRR